MKQPKKSATVSVKASQQQILDAQKWLQFVAHCQIKWECLSPDWQEFYYNMGDTGSSSELLNESISKAIEGDKE
jgi:GH35 family endo-1,4-beta-xylanase